MAQCYVMLENTRHYNIVPGLLNEVAKGGHLNLVLYTYQYIGLSPSVITLLTFENEAAIDHLWMDHI